MARPRKFGLRCHKATGVHYVTLPDGTFKYFSKDPETAQREHAAWLLAEQSPASENPEDIIPSPVPVENNSLRTVRDVCNAYLSFLKRNRGPKHFKDMKVALQEFCDLCVPAGTKLSDPAEEVRLVHRTLRPWA